MQTRRIATMVTVVAVLILLTATNSTVAGPPVEGGEGSGKITLVGTVASKISYQGRLTDAGGNPLNGNYNLVFQLWDDTTAGNQVGSDIVKTNVPVSNGLFTVGLDVPQDAFNGQALWLRVQVNGQWLSPRQELLPVPYALSLKPGATILSPGPTTLHAHNESGGYGVEAWSQNNIGLLGASGPVFPQPSGMYGVYGISDGIGVYGISGGIDGIGVYGDGVYGTGVYGKGANDGVKGESPHGSGVYGDGGHTGVYGVGAYDGVKGESTEGSGVHGLSTNGVGVLGETNAAHQSGVRGQSTNGKGVEGHTSSSDPWVPAIYGKNIGAGDGVYGWSQYRHGVFGVTYCEDAKQSGVYGESIAGFGVTGRSTNNIGVQGFGISGVKGNSTVNYGDGVVGEASGYLGSGVVGKASGEGGSGVEGYFTGTAYGTGVYGNRGDHGTWGVYSYGDLGVYGDITATGSKTGFVVDICLNDDDTSLERGEVVVISGVTEPVLGTIPVPLVRRVTDANATGIIGVVDRLYQIHSISARHPEMQGGVASKHGPNGSLMEGMTIAPGTYLSVVTLGAYEAIRADASYGAIHPGDLLTSSPTPGHAMKAQPVDVGGVEIYRPGTIIGKALQSLDSGQGLIEVFIILQ